MSESNKKIELKLERIIPSDIQSVFDGWLDPKVPGTIWNGAEKFIIDARVDGLYYWHIKGNSHYGRFTQIDRPHRMQQTWMSPNTLGEESVVTVTFQNHPEGTLMTLIHSNLPDHEKARSHQNGWNYFMGLFFGQFGKGSRQTYNADEAPSCSKK